ncbi:uncharacterized protein BDZ99DRAFT_577063 [Mytilinidion resinicola]|uniref:TPR-like protein n=1 Tax=Mytilinidion resinicola TaxID=574789 RepID=A0A6A6Y2R2_9PEZI|nr:uncharacterized protein BDZ99DRAFT_577063 [Mytilinidion resinicola]KAF2802077.1 hypothetical protein BDZ99DRAFT_577063 [Mytilinidion resinicola]
MSTASIADQWSHRRLDVICLYILEDMELKQLIREVKIERDGRELTLDDWKKILLPSWGIFKNNCATEASFILAEKRRIGREEPWDCLVLAGGVLLSIHDVKSCSKRTKRAAPHTTRPPRRLLTFVPMPFNIASLEEIGIFRDFRRLLWFTGVHFDSCFDTGTWSKDENGLYGRSDELRSGLTKLSKLHNMLCDAFKHFKRGSVSTGFALTRSAFLLNELIVQIYHHRQFPDILALILLAQRQGHAEIGMSLCNNLCKLAEKLLPSNDPRGHIFQILTTLKLDLAGDLYVAFDTYCRHLWMSRAGTNEIKAHYSYNQASFPRADTGRFYDLYARKTLDELDRVLEQVNEAFDEYNTARFVMWHTAIRYLLKEARHADAEKFSQTLCSRLCKPGIMKHCSQQPQMNVNVSLSFYLFGVTQFAQLKYQDSMENFQMCINTRRVLVQGYNWDPTLGAALEKLGLAAERMGHPELAKKSSQHLQGMYSALVEKDRMEQALK